MIRDLARLADTRFDLLVVGAGIHGVFVAWDAVLRGLSVAIVEAEDFGGGASANSLKVIHGGLRYLQQLDFPRIRESIEERAMWLRLAPQLVRPIPFLIPTRGRGKESPEALAAALRLNDRLSAGANRSLPPEQRIARGRIVDRAEALRLVPLLDSPVEAHRMRGAAIWHDGQAVDTERLTLAILLSAAERGVAAANYLRCEALRVEGGRIAGARLRDALGGGVLDARARAVVNATGGGLPFGGWEGRGGFAPARGLAVNLITRPVGASIAFGVRSRRGRAEDPLAGGGRFLFFVPWRGSALIGTFYEPWDAGRPPRVDEARIESILEECRESCPSLRLERADVRHVHAGLLPLEAPEGTAVAPLLRHARVVDHARSGGPGGLVSIFGIKYTTARKVAERAVDRILVALGSAPGSCRTASTPLYGADGQAPAPGAQAPPERLRRLHGARAAAVLDSAREIDPGAERPLAPGCDVLRAEVVHAARAEMAVRLADVVLRRTDLGSEMRPAEAALEAAADLMARVLGWSPGRRDAEISEVRAVYPR